MHRQISIGEGGKTQTPRTIVERDQLGGKAEGRGMEQEGHEEDRGRGWIPTEFSKALLQAQVLPQPLELRSATQSSLQSKLTEQLLQHGRAVTAEAVLGLLLGAVAASQKAGAP